MAQPIASFVVSIKDGHIYSQGSVSDVLAKDRRMAAEAKKEQQEIDKVDEQVDEQPPADEPKNEHKLIVAEEVELGHISWEACMLRSKLTGPHSS